MCCIDSPGPTILEARITSSLFPDFLNQDPMIFSVLPWVSGRAGVEYISAVSRKLTPCSSAYSICSWPSASVFCCPQVMVPRQILLTLISEFGRVVYFICYFSLVKPAGLFIDSSMYLNITPAQWAGVNLFLF